MTRSGKEKVILFRCHFMSDEIMGQYQAIKNACALRYDVIILFDRTNGEFKFDQGCDFFMTGLEDIRTLGYPVWQGRGLHFHMDYAVLHFFRTHPAYKQYWVLEYDVRFSGNWMDFFAFFNDHDADILSTFVRSYGLDPQWAWWDLHNLNIARDQLMAIFCPVVMFSKRALELLHEKYSQGTYGYCEVVIPTILQQSGLKVEDISERFYDPFGSFNYNGVLFRTRGKLLHPVKKISLIKRLIAAYRFFFRAKYDSHWSIRIGRWFVYKILRVPEPFSAPY